jgi:hypothetical protein
MQDATFSELLRRLQRLDVDPQLPGDAATAAAPAGGAAEDAASHIRAVCQSSANIDFAAALKIACSSRTAKVCTLSPLPLMMHGSPAGSHLLRPEQHTLHQGHGTQVLTQPCRRFSCNAQEQQADEDQAQQAGPEALQDLPGDDGQEEEEEWQLPSAGGLQRASWVTGYRADDFEEADAELDDLPETDYMVRDIPCNVEMACHVSAFEHADMWANPFPYALMSVLPGATCCWAIQLPGQACSTSKQSVVAARELASAANVREPEPDECKRAGRVGRRRCSCRACGRRPWPPFWHDQRLII